MKKVRVTFCRCQRCGHKWCAHKRAPLPEITGVTSDGDTDVVVCPKCKSPYWDKAK